MRGLLPPGARYRDRACANSPAVDVAAHSASGVILRSMKTLTLAALGSLFLASSFALADDPAKAKTITVEIPLEVRTEIYLRQAKRETAAKADRILGADTYTKRLAQRESLKPRRYVPRTITLKTKAKAKEE